jgi:hypothetical protein
MSPPVKRRITAAERATSYQPRPRAELSSATASYRKHLLVPVVPVATLVGVVLLIALLQGLPRPVALPIMLAAWIASLVDATRRSRTVWVVAIAVFWPSLVAYWTVRVLRLSPAVVHELGSERFCGADPRA